MSYHSILFSITRPSGGVVGRWFHPQVRLDGPDSKVLGTNMGPTWFLSALDGPHVGPMSLAIRGATRSSQTASPGRATTQVNVLHPIQLITTNGQYALLECKLHIISYRWGIMSSTILDTHYTHTHFSNRYNGRRMRVSIKDCLWNQTKYNNALHLPRLVMFCWSVETDSSPFPSYTFIGSEIFCVSTTPNWPL